MDAAMAVLSPRVRAGISVLACLPEPEVAQALNRLRDDLASGAWHTRRRHLLNFEAFDLGYYLVIACLPTVSAGPAVRLPDPGVSTQHGIICTIAAHPPVCCSRQRSAPLILGCTVVVDNNQETGPDRSAKFLR